jgi:hypothetical protein
MPVVPASDDLAVLDLCNRDSRDLHSLILRRKSQLVARVRHSKQNGRPNKGRRTWLLRVRRESGS